MNTLSSTGEELIQSFETLRLAAYQDEGGVWTIGWGHTGPEAFEGATCTPIEAANWFAEDVKFVERAVDMALTTHCTQNQFDALCSFAYNVGIAAFGGSTLLALVNDRNFAAAAEQFGRWDHVQGRVSAGLDKRRAAERALFEGVRATTAPATFDA